MRRNSKKTFRIEIENSGRKERTDRLSDRENDENDIKTMNADKGQSKSTDPLEEVLKSVSIKSTNRLSDEGHEEKELNWQSWAAKAVKDDMLSDGEKLVVHGTFGSTTRVDRMLDREDQQKIDIMTKHLEKEIEEKDDIFENVQNLTIINKSRVDRFSERHKGDKAVIDIDIQTGQDVTGAKIDRLGDRDNGKKKYNVEQDNEQL